MSIGLDGGGPSTKPTTSFGEQFSSSFGHGSSRSGSESYSYQAPDEVWGAQAPFLQALYQQGAAQLGQGVPEGVNEIFQGAAGGLNQLFNPGVNPHLQAYQRDVGRNLNENILPSIDRAGGGFGQLGGSRGEIARGLAGVEANRDISDMASRLYSDDMNRMLGAIQQSPAVANLGLGIPWYGLNQQAGLLGSPVVLDQGGFSTGSSFGKSSQASGSSGYGYNFSEGGGTKPGIGWQIGI